MDNLSFPIFHPSWGVSSCHCHPNHHTLQPAHQQLKEFFSAAAEPCLLSSSCPTGMDTAAAGDIVLHFPHWQMLSLPASSRQYCQAFVFQQRLVGSWSGRLSLL
jgi:hypothetical protein